MLVYLQAIGDPQEKDRFVLLYETYRDMMFRVANRILHNDQDAEDAVHDAFVVLAEQMQKFSFLERHKTKALLVTIVENKAIDRYRQKARRAEAPLTEEIHGVQPPPEAEASALAQCVLRLPGRYREFLRLKYQLGYSTREIAALMELSWPAARKLEQRTKEKLRELCEEEGIL